MSRLSKEDLAQINRPYLESLDPDRLLDVAWNLRQGAVEFLERLEQNSRNSSRPPSSDSPFDKPNQGDEPRPDSDDQSTSESEESSRSADREQNNAEEAPEQEDTADSSATESPEGSGRSPGKQPGAKGFWRHDPLVPEKTVDHHPECCAACSKPAQVPEGAKPHMGRHELELELPERKRELRVRCIKHLYFESFCDCGHGTKARPGEGYVSCVPGRKKDLTLNEYVLVGPLFAAFIASLANWHRMSRSKIEEFLSCWLHTPLSRGTIDRCVREAGIACVPVVEDLIDELQEQDILHLDETTWPEKAKRLWLWVATSATIAVFIIGPRTKEMFRILVTEAFLGWLVTDGYQLYRDHQWRQRCLAHLIRKAVGLSGAVDPEARRMGEWLLRELRLVIKTVAAAGGEAKRTTNPILARLKRACILGEDSDHPKLQALACEILYDWDAVVAFVKNPGLPPTNNFAERALRHAVILRRITFGTRTPEGSLACASLLSVIQTCRLRQVDPWSYIAQTIARGRKGLKPLPIPAVAA